MVTVFTVLLYPKLSLLTRLITPSCLRFKTPDVHPYNYTNAKLRYNLIDGANIITTLTRSIQPFLALEKINGGAPYNDTITQAQINAEFPVNGFYPTYANLFPYGLLLGDAATAIPPNEFAGFLNWKHNKLQAALTANLWEGFSYGAPTDIPGLDPRTCIANHATNIAIPNPATGQFDKIGQYRNPWELNVGMQIRYDITPNVRASVLLANVYNHCFAGSAEPWTKAYAPNQFICEYVPNSTYVGVQPGAGFFYGNSPHDPVNGTTGYPPIFDQAYAPSSNQIPTPFQAYFQLQVRI